jgi:hypothetical protein
VAKKRQSKSGSRVRHKRPSPTTRGVTVNSDGSQTLHLSREEAAIFEVQRQRFIDKFGRQPNPDEPIFFDEEADTPQVPSESVHGEQWAAMVEMIRAAGAPPDVLHAMCRTERIITSSRWFVIPGVPTNEHHMTLADLEQWEAAMHEWRIWQERANKAEAEGEHAAFVYATRHSGLRAPLREEISGFAGNTVSASGATADWMEAVHEWMTEHPAEHDAVAARLEQILAQANKN